jgi:hypothetical protein
MAAGFVLVEPIKEIDENDGDQDHPDAYLWLLDDVRRQ